MALQAKGNYFAHSLSIATHSTILQAGKNLHNSPMFAFSILERVNTRYNLISSSSMQSIESFADRILIPIREEVVDSLICQLPIGRERITTFLEHFSIGWKR